MMSLARTEVAIIGAGPYGLSIAAHLRFHGIDYRIFGALLETWRAHMPRGMYLKSEACASNLFDPAGYTLQAYCAEQSVPYADNVPVSLATFTQYALAFQRRLVPDVENVMVRALDKQSSLFELQLASGQRLQAQRVVIATGVSHAAHVPEQLTGLPAELVSHSSGHDDLSSFAGRSVTVVGAGQSALETAALLHEAGAEVRLVARRPALQWNGLPFTGRRSLYQRLRRPMSALGPGLGPWLYSNAPRLFHNLPRAIRIARVKKALGPAGAWWLKDRVLDRLPIMCGYSLEAARTSGAGILLDLQAADGTRRQVVSDHVIAATGYRFTLGGLPFLSTALVAQLRAEHQTPILSANFESSVPGLYFTGLASANQFGPAMRFLHGAGYTARRVSRHIAKGSRRLPDPYVGGPEPACTDNTEAAIPR